MYITSCNKNNQSSGFTSDTTMSLNDKLSNVMQSRSTSRPPVASRMTTNDDEMVSSRFSELPRGKIQKRTSYYLQQSRQMHSELIGPQMSSFDKMKSSKKDEDREYFMGGSEKGGVKKIQTERSRVLRPIAASNMMISKGSVERGFKEMAQYELIDMEQLFQVETSLHQRKRYSQMTPKIGMKAVLPDIFSKSILQQSNFIPTAEQTNELKKSVVETNQDTPSSFNLLTPGDNQNLNDSNISQTAAKNFTKTNMKHRTERLEGSRIRDKSQQKIPSIKVRPLSSTKRPFILNEQQHQVSSDKTRMGLNIVRSSSTLLHLDPSAASMSTSAHTTSIVPDVSITASNDRKPPKDSKKTTRAPSKGLCGLPLTTIKNKRLSINAPTLQTAGIRDDSLQRKSITQLVAGLNEASKVMIKCGPQERRFLDLLLWQTLPQSTSPLATLTALWNYLSNQHFALRPLDLEQTRQSLKHVSSLQEMSLHTAFSELCSKQWVKSVVKEVTQGRELTNGLRTSGYGSKAYVTSGSAVIVGYEIQGVKESAQEVASDECDIYLITIPSKQGKEASTIFEQIKWQRKGGENQPAVYEMSISMDAK